jgi:hypothetical protein
VADQHGGADLGGKVDRPLGLPHPLLAFAVIGSRGLEQIGGGMEHPHRQRAEIVDGTDLYHPVLHRLEDSRDERNPDPVAELDPLKSQVGDFPQHGVAVLVALRAPAGREGGRGVHSDSRIEKARFYCTKKPRPIRIVARLQNS